MTTPDDGAFALEDHDLAPGQPLEGIRYEHRPCRDEAGEVVDGLHHVWITLDRPEKMNAYTTEMVKGLILAFRRAANDRAAVSVVLTGAGDRAFCTGGDAVHYATYYAGRPEEFRQYLRLFSDAVTTILRCDKPVICRVNGMRIAGGQELGMACDMSIASDLAMFGQAGPRNGSAPDMGSTDMLPLFVGIERALVSCTLCEPWTAYEAERLGLVSEIVPVLLEDGRHVRNPLVITDRWLDEDGTPVWGRRKEGDALAAGKARLKAGQVDLGPLDEAVDRLGTKLLHTMPGCLSKTLESLRKHKLDRWEAHRDTNRSWLALNLLAEGRAGFAAFARGERGDRQVDFVELRRRIARGDPFDDAMVEAVMPASARKEA